MRWSRGSTAPVDHALRGLSGAGVGQCYTDLRNRLRQVRITVYENLGTKEFYCPSGVGVKFEAVPSDVAITHSVLLNASSPPPNLNIYQRK